MSNWATMVTRANTRANLRDLTTNQVHAVVDMLCLVIYADNRMSALEQIEFEETLLELDWTESKEQIVRARINTASSPARYANSREARLELVSKAVKLLGQTVDDQNEGIFGLIASMAFSDLVLHRREKELLNYIADALNIASERAVAIQSQFA